MCELESLKTIAALCFFTGDIEYRVNKLSALCVVTFCPVVTSSTLSCYLNKLINSENSWSWLNLPKTKLSGLKICPNGPDLMESMVPGSKSTRTERGTYLPPEKKHFKIICWLPFKSYINKWIILNMGNYNYQAIQSLFFKLQNTKIQNSLNSIILSKHFTLYFLSFDIFSIIYTI